MMRLQASPASPQEKQCQTPFAGLIEHDGVSSGWNGHETIRRRPMLTP